MFQQVGLWNYLLTGIAVTLQFSLRLCTAWFTYVKHKMSGMHSSNTWAIAAVTGRCKFEADVYMKFSFTDGIVLVFLSFNYAAYISFLYMKGLPMNQFHAYVKIHAGRRNLWRNPLIFTEHWCILLRGFTSRLTYKSEFHTPSHTFTYRGHR
jgi:hypothetical protein